MSVESAKPKCGSQAGFSLVELMVVVLIAMVIGGMAVVNLQTIRRNARVDTALKTTVQQLRQARQSAIDQRRVYRVTFSAPGTVTTEILPRATGCSYNLPVAVSTVTLPFDIQFRNEPGIPITTATTPDGFGTGANAIDFDINYSGGGGTQVYFQPDGSVQDNLCRVNNGVIYMARAGQLNSSRAVSLYGTSGRIKGWALAVKADGTKRWY